MTLELGGKSPQIVWPDANLDEVVPVAALSIFANQGQTCASGSRIYVHRSVLNDFVARIKVHAESITVGDPLADGTDMGSLISEKQMRRVLGYIASAREEGATLVTGGSRIGDRGYFVEPTVFVGNNDLTIAQEEIFGPVGTIVPFDDDDEVLDFANGTDYGLTAVLWTNDVRRINDSRVIFGLGWCGSMPGARLILAAVARCQEQRYRRGAGACWTACEHAAQDGQCTVACGRGGGTA